LPTSKSQTGKSVFVVDDDASMLMSMNRLLQQHGFNARMFKSAGALLGLGTFEEASCIVLDINLEDESGIDLHRRLVDQGIKIPTIFVTGNDSHAARVAAIETGCIAYLAKPFSAKSFIESVEKACASAA
jgi:FixJ family two-component response regulator